MRSIDLHRPTLSMKMKYFSYVSLFLDVKCSHVISYIKTSLTGRLVPSYPIIVDITALHSGGGRLEQCSRSQINPVLFRINQH